MTVQIVMGKKEARMIQGIASVLENHCGLEISKKVMEGSGSIGSSRTDAALWVKGAMERMDRLVDSGERTVVMEECGRNCCSINKGVVVTFNKRKAKCGSLEAFLENEIKSPVRGTRLARRGNAIRFYYTPKQFGKGMRCYCSLVSALPEQETMSKTYCSCSVGFVKSLWEQLVGGPVQAKLVRSALTGSDECEFEIKF